MFWQALGGMLLALVSSFVGRVLTALGLSFVTYEGFTLITDQLRTMFQAQLSGLPSDVIGILGMLKIGTCFSILLGAMAVKWTAAGLAGGSFKTLQRK
jgi:hypothetical protein